MLVVLVLLALGGGRTIVSRMANARSLEAGTQERAKIYVKTTADSGNLRQQTFCPECASPIYSAPADGNTKVVVLRVGSVRQRAELVPQHQYWFRSAQPWLASLPAIKKQDKQPVVDASGNSRRP